MIDGFRKCEKLIDGVWILTPFRDLKKGDVFRLFESSGERVGGPRCRWIAESSCGPMKGNRDLYGITAKQVERNE